jgi:hypothetical protein
VDKAGAYLDVLHFMTGLLIIGLVANPLYAFGALLCVISTRWSIAIIVLAQFYFAVAPRLRRKA